MSDPEKTPAPVAAVHRKGSFLRTVRAVAWAFIGLRKGSEYRKDLESVNPLHIIAIALLGFVLLVLSLIVVVNWVV